jgi:hypothetical protein
MKWTAAVPISALLTIFLIADASAQSVPQQRRPLHPGSVHYWKQHASSKPTTRSQNHVKSRMRPGGLSSTPGRYHTDAYPAGVPAALGHSQLSAPHAGTTAATPVPRQYPGGLGRSTSIPVHLGSELPGTQQVSVENRGDKALNFSYWDGDSGWKTLQLHPGQPFMITCAKCGETVRIAFHDGQENQVVTVKMRDHYALYWNRSKQRWDFGPLDTLQRSGALSR